VRVDTGFDDGDTIAPFYDSMIAKVIVHGPDRPSAIRRMDEALSTLSIGGIASTKPLLLTLIRSAEFAQTQHSTTFIETSNVLKELT
jgi:acetyl-CoA carboxylase biotin carboxylase subunit